MHGKPGVGKSTMAEVLIAASGRPFFVCRKTQSDGAFLDTIRQTFDEAIEAAPSIIFLDDMDKFANEGPLNKDAEEYVAVQSCIDECRDCDVFILATANTLLNFPDSLLRPGRFDRVIKINPPVGDDAVKIVEHYLKCKKLAAALDSEAITKLMCGKSCADLETIINEAGILAGYNRSEFITTDHVVEAFLRTQSHVSLECIANRDSVDLSRLDRNSAVVWHEAGHAAIAELLFPRDVTLVFAQNGSGFVQYINDSNNKKSLCQPDAHIIIALGGKAAVELTFGILDFGAKEDIKQAFLNMRELIEDVGNSGFDMIDGGRIESDNMLKRREHAAAVMVERCFLKAKEILCANKKLFEAIAYALAEKGVLTSSDIAEIRKNCVVTPAEICDI